ncbi:hypothetical protein PMI42_05373 [Bradyrhizobium sp. YR681]|uniref:hypothetical protein n=1 Tax=Bradyrhizobium sp. YR681 TaxID=1144344 RepID=UPI000270FE2D|nr:hypothetical protein [Bradyrhizobium sp. YR681]EJN11338.1 hypothetical protein PMI42_05373 [Bradyrhizobium sp. YR681]
MADSNFQRVGAEHNAGVGRSFEAMAQTFFKATEDIDLVERFPVEIGVSTKKKVHRFDLGSRSPALLIECKSHTWTETGNMPSAKMTVWNEAMYYFLIAPQEFRKVLFVLKHHNLRRDLTLASYYLRTHSHMVPDGVEVWEFDTDALSGERLR